MKKYQSVSELKNELDKAFEHIYTKETHEGKYTYTYYYIIFHDMQVFLPEINGLEVDGDPIKLNQYLRKSAFYKAITS